ncbi:hypothetical protein GCM10011335_23590 [Aureimonas glaciei]|uniref:site-specific DNA-methyltransferase (adenine-specific) n=2 Tax=Aureimonas glaciei TaxID=1776957 RepID=A0A917DB39_9HYPH|nr:hypothetical protein GCM10011335_23590 [Aureimonas glaciei]
MDEPRLFLGGRVALHAGDCLDVLRGLPDNSIDAINTDPPYALTSITERFGGEGAAPAQFGTDGAFARASRGFMGKKWDTGERAFSVEFWRECLRVLKPGGHLVAFSGTRTYHRMAVAIEDAGFDIRDQLAWAYGTGFPKSHNVSKALQRRRVEDVSAVRVICRAVRDAMDARDLKSKDLVLHFGGCHPRLIDHWAARDTDSQPALPTWQQWETLTALLALDRSLDAEVRRLNDRKGLAGDAWTTAEVLAEHDGVPGGFGEHRFSSRDRTIREATDEAAEWVGWQTALKPAWEPICLARKPVEGTVAENCLKWGTGALNVGGCRVGQDSVTTRLQSMAAVHGGAFGDPATSAARRGLEATISDPRVGRYPANIVHDGSAEVASCFPMVDEVSASRFFYSAKADGDDRHGLNHPTIKPVDLMRWLARLTCRKGGTILDPFAGTGTTAEAAYWEGCNAVLVEREEEYQAAIAIRMGLVLAGPDEKKRARTKLAAAEGLPLFGGVEAEPAPFARGVLGGFADDALTAQERGKAATARKARARANDKSQSGAAQP